MKKWIYLLAEFLILLSFIGCGDSSEDVRDTSEEARDTGDNQQASGNENGDVPDFTFEGEEFNMLLTSFSQPDFFSETITGDRINDTIYERNALIEEKYKVKLNPIVKGSYDESGYADLTSAVDAYRKAVQSGDDIYDVFFGFQFRSIVDSMNGLNVDFSMLPYVDLTKPWWDDGILDINYGDKVYFAAGDITYTTASFCTLLVFNKNLFLNKNIPYPYEDVKTGKWTYEKFISIIRDLSHDLDGDGLITPESDIYSIAGWQYSTPYHFLTALGGKEVSKDGEGLPQIGVTEPKTLSAMERILDIYTKNGGWLNSTSDYFKSFKMFEEGRAYFHDLRFIELKEFTQMQDDFGMIPHPKYDESTPYYTQLVDHYATVVTVPITNRKLEMTSILLEAFASEGKRMVTPEYIEVLLKIKLMRDDESAEMFDYIWGHRTYKYNLSAYENVLVGIAVEKNYSFVSRYEKLQGAAENELEKIREVFNSN